MELRNKLGWLAGISAAATVLLGVPPAAAEPSVVTASGPLTDLQAAAHATDGADAQLFAVAPGNGSTYFVFVLTGLDPDAAGTTYGAHVHVGPCVPGNGAAALGHYNTGTGGEPSPENEVWLDFTVLPGGVGYAVTTAPFEIEPGTAQSVVIHALPTEPGTGLAGGRIACLPVEF